MPRHRPTTPRRVGWSKWRPTNAALRRELQTVHEALRYERAQAELLAKAHEQLTRALPAPAAVAGPYHDTATAALAGGSIAGPAGCLARP